MKKWAQRLYHWWVIGDWHLAKQQQEFDDLRRQLRAGDQ